MKQKIFIILFVLFLFFFMNCGGDKIVINEEIDKTILQINKSENKNKVIYAVKTDGNCSVLDVFVYWKMDEEGGSTETLLSYEESTYGVQKYTSQGTQVTFSLNCYPKKKIKIVIEETKLDNGNVYCDFLGIGIIQGEKGITQKINVQNDGWTVLKAEIEGIGYKDRSRQLTEALPTECE